MRLLVLALWPGLAGALLLGLAAGWLTGPAPGRAVPLGLIAAVLALAGLAAAGVVPGTAGLWVEGAALLLPAYLAGCGTGALVRRITPGRDPS